MIEMSAIESLNEASTGQGERQPMSLSVSFVYLSSGHNVVLSHFSSTSSLGGWVGRRAEYRKHFGNTGMLQPLSERKTTYLKKYLPVMPDTCNVIGQAGPIHSFGIPCSDNLHPL